MKKLLYCFFLLIAPCFIYAAEQSYNTIFSLGSSNQIESCSNSKHFSVYSNSLNWYARWSSNPPTSAGSEDIICKLRDDSTKTITIQYTNVIKDVSQQFTINIDNLNPTFDINDVFRNIYKITNVEASDANIDISKCQKNGVACVISAKDFSKEGTGTVTLKYEDEDKFTFTTTVSVNISSSKIYLNVGGYGTCSISGWTLDNKTKMYYKKSVNGVSLPDCTVSSKYSNLLNFEGWVPTNSGSNTDTVDEFDLTVSNCKKLPGLVKGNGSADIQYTAYATCYSYKTTFELIPDGGTMTGVTCTSNSNGACLVVGSNSLKLPNVTSSNEKYEFVGWVDSRNGNVHEANSTVSIEDGSKVTFRAKYDIKKLNDSHNMTVGLSLNSTATSLSDLVGLDDISFNNASVVSGAEFTSVINSGGEIMVLPQKVGQTVLTSTVSDGKTTDTYTITIDVYDSNSPIRKTEYAVVDEDDFSMSWDDDEIVNVTDTGTLSVCDKFLVADGISTGGLITYGGGSTHSFNMYSVKPQCGEDRQYRSMCLDPGLLGPKSGQYYKFKRKLDLSNKFDRVLFNLVSELEGLSDISANKYTYGAVNFVGRIFTFYAGYQRTDNIQYVDHYNIYRDVANLNKAGLASGVTTLNWPSGITPNSYFNNEVQRLYRLAVTKYNESYSPSEEEAAEILLKNDKKEFSWEGNSNLIVTRTGMIKLPSGSTDVTITNNCSSFGYDCSGSTVSDSVDADGYREYTLMIRINNVNTRTKIPDEDGNRLKYTISYDSGMSKGTAFLIEHQTNTYAYQRMILINLGKSEFIIYGDINGDGCNTSNPALDPSRCTESSCNINEKLFEELKCCNKITDKSSYAFKRLCSGGDCTFSSFTPVCGTDTNSSDGKHEITQISEAKTTAGDPNYSCIIDVDSMSNTNNLKDEVGNYYSLDKYKGNMYCRVSCKEDWFYTTGVFGSFVGDNAVTAGSYFIIKDDLFLSNKRTCATTYLDYDLYAYNMTNLASQLVQAWNDFSKDRAIYTALDETPLSKCVETHPKYYEPSEPYTHYHCAQTYCADFYCRSCNLGECYRYYCSLGTCASWNTDPETGARTTCASRYSPTYCDSSTCASCGSCSNRYSTSEAVSTSDWKCASCGSYYSDSNDYRGSSGVCRSRYGNTTTLSTCKYYDTDTVYKEEECVEWSLTTEGNEPYYTNDNYNPSPGGNIEHRLSATTYRTSNTVTGGGGVTNIYKDGVTLYTGNFGHTAGSCKNPAETCEQMKERYLNDLRAQVDADRARITSLIAQMDNHAEQFAACSNFALTTDSLYDDFKDGSHRYGVYNGNVLYTNNENLTKGNVSSTDIEHKFSPFITYSYEEEDYMKMIGSDNYMTPYKEKNNAGGSLGTLDGTDIKVDKFVYKTEYSNSEDKTEGVYNNDMEGSVDSDKLGGNNLTSFSCKRVNPTTKACNGWIQICPDYPGYETLYDKSDSWCYTGVFTYYEVHYVRQSVYNGSYWKNKGMWYVNNEDEKSHADTLSEAASRSYVVYSRGVEDDWSVLGGYNVFPVSMSTRRNLYQYYYNFFNIGMYNDGALGRIMGGEVDLTGRKVNNGHNRTVVSYNTHACFYEVVESICRCCGEKIVPYVNTITGVDSQYYSSLYRGSGKMSDIDMDATQGTLAMYTNTISLSNFSSATNRVLGANWQAQTPFFYAGERFTTNQGAELLSAIQSVGDSVYTKYPDYSYTLNPSAIALVREYNKSHSYAIDTKNLKIYGRVPFKSSDVYNGDEQITFNHYGSKYLETSLNSYITPEYKGHTLVEKTGPNSICTVNEGTVESEYGKQNYSSSCRWVDYNTSSGYRLAFK